MRKRKVFASILFSYVIIMLLPMVGLGTVLFNFFYRTYDAELINNRDNSLSRMQITMDTIINEMNANAHMMHNTKEFTTRHLEEAYGNFYDVTRKLADVAFTANFIDGVFYINSSLERIFTPQTMYRYDDFMLCGSGYNIPASTTEDLLIQKNRRSYWLPMHTLGKDQPDILTYVVTNKISRAQAESSVFFQISRESLDRLTGEFNGAQSCTIMASEDDVLLYSSNAALSDIAWKEWTGYAGDRTLGPIKLAINGETYVFLQKNSTESPLYYVAVIPYQTIREPIEKHQTLFFLGILVVTGICAAFISYFMKVNYAPVRSISKLISSLFSDDASHATTDLLEFEKAKHALERMSEAHSSLVRDKITLRLMRGGYPTLEALEAEGRPVDFRLTGPFFRVVVFRIEGSAAPLDLNRYQEISTFIEDNLHVYTDANAVHYSEDDSIFLVLSGLDEEMCGLSEKYMQIKNVIENAYSITLSIGVGNVVQVNEVLNSASQATAACNYNFVKGLGSITFYSEIENEHPAHFIYPNRAIDALHHAILQGESERVQFAIGTLVKHISDTKSLFYGTCLAYDILNTAMKAMRELNYQFSSFQEIHFAGKGALRSIDEIVDIVNQITSQIVELISERANTGGEKAVAPVPLSNFEQIMHYITAHYCEDTFSVKSLADHFDMSISNFSHYFKNRTGQTVSEYIALLRFDRSKELLSTTDMNLQDIASLCGYLHLSTFMRQFKQREDCTPASYRAQERHAHNTGGGRI